MKSEFPSYKNISAKIAHQQRQECLNNIAKIDKKIDGLKANLDLDGQHRALIKNLIAAHHRDAPIH